jgi:small subunit ribosomal protein S1
MDNEGLEKHEREMEEERRTYLRGLREGEWTEGTVTNLVDFGAFVKVGPVDGLVHLSELADYQIDHPAEVVRSGQKVRVLEVDEERGRVALSLRQPEEAQ